MSYILTDKSNPVFNLMALVLAPMLKSRLVLKLDADRNVDLVLNYNGVQPDTDWIEPSSNDPAHGVIETAMNTHEHPGTLQQVAVFDVIESYNKDVDQGSTLRIPLTETTLEHAMFAFIPNVIPSALDTEKLVQSGD